MMAALLCDGEAVAAWMHDPVGGDMHIAERASGAWMNGERVFSDSREGLLGELSGAVLRRFLPEPIAEQVVEAEGILGPVMAGSKCAGFDYPSIVKGELDFALYWRTLPWDHVPGVLFLHEAGGRAARLDGAPYLASDVDRTGLLAARTDAVWLALRDLFAPSD